MSDLPVIIKPGDEIVFEFEGTRYLIGKLVGCEIATIVAPPLQERFPMNEDEYRRHLQGCRFFERERGPVRLSVAFNFEQGKVCETTAKHAADNTPDSSSD